MTHIVIFKHNFFYRALVLLLYYWNAAVLPTFATNSRRKGNVKKHYILIT